MISIDAANELKVPIEEITNKYTNIYNEDMSKLLVMAPDIQPKATEYIPEMIALINDLIDKNHAYEKDGHVFFMYLRMKIMEAFQKEIVKNRLLEVGLKLHHLKRIQLILFVEAKQ